LNVANSLNSYFNNGGALPPAFVAVYNLNGAALSKALDQLSGEPGAALVEAGNDTLTPFLDALFNRLSDVTATSFGTAGLNGVKPAQLGAANGMKAWASMFGGRRNAQGNTSVSSHSSHAEVMGISGGIDSDVTSDLTMGAGVALGRMNFGIDQGLGGGGSNVAELGGYAHRRIGNGYVTGAVAYAWHDMSTHRPMTIGGVTSVLGAKFTAKNYGGRFEGGKRVKVSQNHAITPYIGFQWEEFDTPAYAEFALSGSADYAVAYRARGTVRSHTELGARFADSYLNNDGALVLNGRLAWQYNLQTSAGAVASFVALPGSSFAVNGAGLDRNLALVSLGLTQENTSRFTYGAKIDAALGPLTQTVFGTMMVGYRF
jgi:uncharacterized protein with beta-barrel porin domain